jgi:hypothetical protein
VAGCGGSGQPNAKTLSQMAKSLQSDAAEGALLAEDAFAGKTTSICTQEHAAELDQASARTAVSLKKAKTKPRLQATLRRLTDLSARVSAELKRLSSASEGEQQALSRQLKAAAEASQKIGDGLG